MMLFSFIFSLVASEVEVKFLNFDEDKWDVVPAECQVLDYVAPSYSTLVFWGESTVEPPSAMKPDMMTKLSIMRDQTASLGGNLLVIDPEMSTYDNEMMGVAYSCP